MKLNEITLYENRSHRILQEGWQDLNEAQQSYQLRFEKELWPLVESYVKLLEQELTTAQIQKIFTSAEQVSKATGKNKTALGKAGTIAKDTVKKINDKINELGRQAAKAGPVKNADAKLEKLKKDILANNKDNKIVKGVESISNWAKENPGKASLAVGILTTIAAFAGGPAGGAAAGMILRGTKELLQGEKLSTAVGKSAKFGALGALVGLGVEGLGDAIEGAANIAKDTLNPAYMRASWDYMETVNGVPDDWAEAYLVGYPDDITPAREAWNKAIAALKADDYATFEQEWKVLEDTVEKFNSEEYQASLEGSDEDRAEWAEGIAAFSKMADGVQAAAQGATQAAGNKTESIEEQIKSALDAYELTEAPAVAAALGGAARGIGKATAKGVSKAINTAGSAVKSAGNELSNKVTAKKLMRMWNKSGKPTDMGSVVNILNQAGISDEQIGTVGKQARIALEKPKNANSKDTTGTAQVDPKLQTLADEIKKLGLADLLKPKLADGQKNGS